MVLPTFNHHFIFCTVATPTPTEQALYETLRALLTTHDAPAVLCSHAIHAEIGEHSPLLAVYPHGVWYAELDESRLADIVHSHLQYGEPLEDAPQQRLGTLAPIAPTATPKKSTQQGLVLVNTGEGKGKSTAAFGVILRMLGRKKRVALVQFLKHEGGQWGEVRALSELGLDAVKTGDGWTWTSKDMDETQARALHGWQVAQEKISSGNYDLVVLDEFTYLLDFGWLETESVLAWLRANKPPALHLIITGRGAPQALIDYADTVTNMTKIKHAYDRGIPARAGIEF